MYQHHLTGIVVGSAITGDPHRPPPSANNNTLLLSSAMPSPDHPPSSPPNHATSTEDAIAYYKAQYTQLEAELADFQTSSRELEAELERDIEASEKRERKLKERVEKVQYEADEWKVCVDLTLGPWGKGRLTVADGNCRPSASRPRQKPIPRRTPYKRRSLRCARRTGRCN